MARFTGPNVSGVVLMLGALICGFYVPVMNTRDPTAKLMSVIALAELALGLMMFTLCGSRKWKLNLPEWLFASLEPMLPFRGGWRSKFLLGMFLLGVFSDPLLYLAQGHNVSSDQHWFAIGAGLLANLMLAGVFAVETVRMREAP